MTVEFEVPGIPRGKGRPRFARMGKYVRTYTPEETASYENLVKLMYMEQSNGAFLRGALQMEVTAYFPTPKSASKKKRLAMLMGKIFHVTKPDLDNVIKSAADGTLGVAYHDDSQIVTIVARKLYAEEGKLVVRITELEAEDYQKIGE